MSRSMSMYFLSPLTSRLQEPGRSYISPQRFIEEFSMEVQDLAARAGVHRNTLRVSPDANDLQRFMRASLKVVEAAIALNNDPQASLYWYRNQPLRPFGQRTAEE